MNDQYAKNANKTPASRVSSFWQEGFTLIHLHEFHMSHIEHGKGQSEPREARQAWVSMPCHRIIKEDSGSVLEGGCSSLIEAVQQTWPPKAAHVKMGTFTRQAWQDTATHKYSGHKRPTKRASAQQVGTPAKFSNTMGRHQIWTECSNRHTQRAPSLLPTFPVVLAPCTVKGGAREGNEDPQR